MKTEDLINALAQDDGVSAASLRRRTAVAMAIGVVLAATLFVLFIGFRPDTVAAFATWRFSLKIALIALAVGVVAWEFARQFRPMAKPSARPILIVAAALAAAVALEAAQIPAEAWAKTAAGTNWLACLSTIPFLAAAPLAAAVWAMRSGAPASPIAAGAAAGGLAAAIGALFYGLHCTDDSPLFVAIWYPLAALIVTAAGAALGRWTLRW